MARAVGNRSGKIPNRRVSRSARRKVNPMLKALFVFQGRRKKIFRVFDNKRCLESGLAENADELVETVRRNAEADLERMAKFAMPDPLSTKQAAARLALKLRKDEEPFLVGRTVFTARHGAGKKKFFVKYEIGINPSNGRIYISSTRRGAKNFYFANGRRAEERIAGRK
ncbi:MAG: hypothetical protein PHH08_01880 [Candidatus ainarchaeum sp.]|nr:hypothetical protein [Candidatus ainarchaeum sp.]